MIENLRELGLTNKVLSINTSDPTDEAWLELISAKHRYIITKSPDTVKQCDYLIKD